MKKKSLKSITAVIVMTALLSQEAVAGIKIPDIGKMASDAAAGISDAAGKAGEAISDTAGKAGEVISDTAQKAGETIAGAAGQAGEAISGAAQSAGKAASGAAKQVSQIASGFASQAGDVVSGWGKQAGETADGIKENLAGAGVKIKDTAEQLGNATAEKVAALTDKAGKAADDAINAVSGAGDFVVDQAGHVVDLAAAGAGYVTAAAGGAMKELEEKGSVLMKIAEDAVADLDLSEPENWEAAKASVNDAIEKAYAEGILDDEKIDEETIQIVTSIVFGTMMYGYQYSNGQITLGEYAGNMSEVLIKEGLPTGVGFVVSLLPIKIPHADSIAKEATYYLISIAYGDKSGEEIEAEEEMLLDEVLEEEAVSEAVTENVE